MAAWSFFDTNADQIDPVLVNLQNRLNQLLPPEARSVKMCVVDPSDRVARGVLFYTNEDNFPARPEGTKWLYNVWETKSEYTKLYKDVADALNGRPFTSSGASQQLSASQAYYSIVCFSDHKGRPERIALYWLA